MVELNKNQQLVFEDRYQYQGETIEGMWDRLAKAASSIEKDSTLWYHKFFDILKDFKFVPGGRIMSTLGTGNPQPLFNCYVIPSPEDSREGIMANITKMIEIMARGGGVGVDLSTLRYKDAEVKGVRGKSSGVVAWADLYSGATGTIQQGGSRRGALLLSLRCDHPDIIDFIKAKETPGRLSNANLSVLITDRFMKAVENGESWPLRWKGKVVDNVSARELWRMIADKAHKTGEPGIIFIDRYNKMNNTWYVEEIVTTNPCGELGLPADGVCCLGSINLNYYYSNTDIDVVDALREDIPTMVRFLDNMIDISPYIYSQNEKVVKRTRRIGLGTMGLADALLRLKLRYGSKDAIDFTDKLYEFIKIEAYKASVALAKEKKAFPLFDSYRYLQGKFIEKLPEDLRKDISEYGIRNASLLTIPPTGSTGLLANASNGIEPVFSWVTHRNDRLGKREVKHWFADSATTDFAVTAMQVTPEEHIRMQAAAQKHIDSSISKTINLPKSATVEDVLNAYSLAYDLGIKGCTVYRDGSIAEQVLSTESDVEKPTPVIDNTTKPALDIAFGARYKVKTGCGTMWVSVFNDEEGNIVETFIGTGKGGCERNLEALSRQISLSLRRGTPMEEVIEQLNDVRACTSFKDRGNREYGNSCSSAIGKAIQKHYDIIHQNIHYKEVATTVENSPKPDIEANVHKCPECGAPLERRGCWTCPECGYEKCE